MRPYIQKIKLDPEIIEYLKSYSEKILTQEWLDAPTPLALHYTDSNDLLVEDHPILNEFRKKHPNLIPVIKLYKLDPGHVPTHYDNHRYCTLNIPIVNCTTDTLTRFYKDGTEVEEIWLESFGAHGPASWNSDSYIRYVKGGEICYQFSLTVPTIMNTKIPHDVLNTTDNYRIMWGWTFDCPFEDAVESFKDELDEVV